LHEKKTYFTNSPDSEVTTVKQSEQIIIKTNSQHRL